ncbi:MAG: Eco57I restriction-modification methylase domain-containing protein [Tenacibaculum sp.]
MHMGDCLGGYVFYDEKFEKTIEEPRYITQGKVTKTTFSADTNILEINSKSGLYPLYVAYSIYRTIISSEFPNIKFNQLTVKEQQICWDKAIANNVFVICKTPMAKSITKRTLVGFKDVAVNTRYFEDLVHQITDRSDKFIEKIRKGKTYRKANNNNDMKFNAIVGNPPYMEMDGGAQASAKPIYNQFVEIAKKIKPEYISMIMPARWYSGGKGLDEFRETMLSDKSISKLFDYPNSKDCFTNVDIAGGLCYFLWDKKYNGKTKITNYINGELSEYTRDLDTFDILIRDNKAISILKKVQESNESNKTLSDRVSSRKPFALPTNYKPKNKGIPCWFIQKIGLKYANKEDVIDSGNYLNKWKLLVPPAPIAGQTDFTKPIGFYYDGNTRIAKPGECCTESFIIAGAFETEKEVQSFKTYLLTKTVRFLLLQRVISQHVTKKVFSFIPNLEKYEGTYTDVQLCKLWGITDDKWNYIDNRVKNI